MNKLKTIPLLLFLTSLIACSDTKSESFRTDSEGIFVFNSDTVYHETSPDSTVISFLKWYRDNEDRLHQIQLLTGGLADTTTFYSVDFEATEKYLTELKKSGFLSDKFLGDLRQHFFKSNEYLKQHPQNDGPAPGFEADLIMKSQDYMDVWDSLESVKVIEQKRTAGRDTIKMIFAGYYKTKYYLTKYGDKWKIDNIENAFAEN